MPRKPAENSRAPPLFPVADYWEELRPSWEGSAPPEGPDPNIAIRNEVIRLVCQRTNAPVPKGLIVELNQVRQVVQSFGLAERNDLAERLFQIAGRYLRPRAQSFFSTSPADTKKHFHDILIAAHALDDLLDNTAGETIQLIETAHESLEKGFGRKPSLQIYRFSTSLTAFTQAVAWVETSIRVPRNRPPKTTRFQAVFDAAQAIEEVTQARIDTSWRKSGTGSDDRFRGAAGAALHSFMKLLEPDVSEGALVRDLRKARKMQSHKKSGA